MADQRWKAVWDEIGEELWQWVPRESPKARAACIDYCRMGAGRSLLKLIKRYQNVAGSGPEKQPTTRLNTLKEWSGKYEWQERIAGWDAHQQRIEQQKWEQRREQVREEDWELGDDLRKLVHDMLEQGQSFIKSKRKVVPADKETGRPESEIITVALKEQLLIKGAELASKLQRQAAEVPATPQRHEHSGTIEHRSAEELTDDELASIASTSSDGTAES